MEQDGGRPGRIAGSHTLYAREELFDFELQGKAGLMCTNNDNLRGSG